MSKSLSNNKNKSIMNRKYNKKNTSNTINNKEQKLNLEILNKYSLINFDDSIDCIPKNNIVQENNDLGINQQNYNDKQNEFLQQNNANLHNNSINDINGQNCQNSDNVDDGWCTIKPKRFSKKKQTKPKQITISYEHNNHKTQPNEINENIIIDENTDVGKNLKFKNPHKIWVHGDDQDWSIKSFDDDFFTIDSVSSFLQFFNNFHKFDLNIYNFFIMRHSDDGTFIEPTWEHKLNRNGCTCSLRIDVSHGIELLQQLCILMVNECLIPDMSLVNGISISKKTNWVLIKIWIKDKNVDISKMLPYAIINSYPSLCVKSKINTPEY